MKMRILILLLLIPAVDLFAQSVDFLLPVVGQEVEWTQEHTDAFTANLEESGLTLKKGAPCSLEVNAKYRRGKYLVSVLFSNTNNGLKTHKHYSCSSYGDELLTRLSGGWNIGGKIAADYPRITAEPGVVTIIARDSGVLSFNGETINVTAGRALTIGSLLAGDYTATMRYEDDFEEKKYINVVGGNTFPVNFSYEYDGFILVKAGFFNKGSPSGESGREDDEKILRQYVKRNFRVSPYEVTQAEYKSVTGYDGISYHAPASLKGANKPIVTISWRATQ